MLLVVALVAGGAGCSKKSKQANLESRADSYFKSGDYDKAKIEYLNLLRMDNQNAKAFQQLGIIWYEQGAPLQALPFLRKSREMSPGSLDARTKLAYAFIAVGRMADARSEAIAILEQSPGYDDAVILLAETAQTKEDMEDTDKRLAALADQNRASIHLARATQAIRAGDLATAEGEAQKALTADPKSASAHLAMATIRFAKKENERAGEHLKSAAELAPLRSAPRLQYVEFILQSGRKDEAKAMLKEMTEKTPDYLTAWRLLAQLAFSDKRYDESLALIDNVLQRDATNLEGRLLQSEVFLAKGDLPRAIEGLERLRKSWPGSAVVMYQLGRAYLRDGNLAQAGLAANDAVSAAPAYTDAILLKAEVALRTGGAEEAVGLMQDLLRKNPGLGQAEFILARGYRALGRLDDAAAIFRAQVKGSPENGTAQLRLGSILREMGRNDEARAALEKAQELEPENLMVTFQLAELDIAGKDFAGAHRRIDAHLQKEPNSAGVRFLSGKVFAAERNWDRAEAELLKAIELDANVPYGYEFLIQTYVDAGRLPQAVSRLEAALAKKPDDAGTLLTMAMLHEKMNALPKAREAYEKLTAAKPDFVPGLNNAAMFLTERTPDLEKASELARKAKNIAPNDPAVADTLGWILYKRGDYQQALALLLDSAGKLPDNPEIQFHLGMANYMMGQTGAAKIALQNAAQAAGDFPWKEEASRRLALLEGGTGTALTVEQLEALVKQQPGDPLAQLRLADAYQKQGNAAGAAAACEQALKSNPKLFAATLKLAQLYAGPLKDGAKALDFARKARDLSPNDRVAAELLGRVSYQTGNYSAAYSILQGIARDTGAGAGALHDFARAAYALGRVAEAQGTFERIANAAPGTPEAADAKSSLAMIVAEGNSMELAAVEPEAQKLLAGNPSHLPALVVKTALQAQRGDTKGAAAACSDILNRFPDFAPAQKRLAALYASDPATRDKAYELAAKALKTLPEDPDLIQTLAELSYHRKQFSSAVQLYMQTAAKRPLNARALYHLGMSQVQQKQKSQGRDSLTRALDSGLEDPLAAEAKRVIAELKSE
jgi:Tfp pilus assembly protein PilF